jgi:hypothetical protein
VDRTFWHSVKVLEPQYGWVEAYGMSQGGLSYLISLGVTPEKKMKVAFDSVLGGEGFFHIECADGQEGYLHYRGDQLVFLISVILNIGWDTSPDRVLEGLLLCIQKLEADEGQGEMVGWSVLNAESQAIREILVRKRSTRFARGA